MLSGRRLSVYSSTKTVWTWDTVRYLLYIIHLHMRPPDHRTHSSVSHTKRQVLIFTSQIF